MLILWKSTVILRLHNFFLLSRCLILLEATKGESNYFELFRYHRTISQGYHVKPPRRGGVCSPGLSGVPQVDMYRPLCVYPSFWLMTKPVWTKQKLSIASRNTFTAGQHPWHIQRAHHLTPALLEPVLLTTSILLNHTTIFKIIYLYVDIKDRDKII